MSPIGIDHASQPLMLWESTAGGPRGPNTLIKKASVVILDDGGYHKD